MSLAAARALSELARERGLGPEAILPRMDDPEVAVRTAVATGARARREGIARRPLSEEALEAAAREAIAVARRGVEAWRERGVIAEPPEP